MAKHNANVDIRGDLRVRGRIERHLRVHEEVEASAFYIRGVGELTIGGPAQITLKDGLHSFADDTVSFNNSQFYLTKDSLGNPEVNVIFPAEAGTSVIFKNGIHTFTYDTVSFNHSQFYLTKDSLGNPEVNLSELSPRPINSRALLSKTTANTITDNAAAATLSWEVEREDLGGWFTPASPTQLTVPSGVSLVRITCKVGVADATAPGATSYTTLNVLKNGASLVPNEASRITSIPVTTIITVAFVNTRVLTVVPGDVFTLTIAVNGWGADPEIATGPTYFAIEAVG